MEAKQEPRGSVVEKVRAVWASEDPRGPSASPQDDTPSKEGGKGKGKGKGKSKCKCKATATATATANTNAGILQFVQNDGEGG
jgi:hypothetical protein